MYVYVEQVESNKYYRGHGEVKSKVYENIQSNYIPFDEFKEKEQYYKMQELTTYTKQTVHHVGENAEISYSYEINTPMKVYGWKFDNVAWENSGVIVEPSKTERIESLEQENEALTHRVSTLQEVNATQEETITNNKIVIDDLSELLIDLQFQVDTMNV